MKRGIILLLMAVAFECTCYAQKSADIMRQLDSITNPPMAHNEALRFEKKSVSLGALCEDDMPVSCHFEFENSGADPLVVTRVITSCGCVHVKFDRKPIISGEKGLISVTFNPKDQAGVLNRHIYVYTNDSEPHPSTRLSLHGQVLPTQVLWNDYRITLSSSLKAKRRTIVFRQISRTQLYTERIECVNTGNAPLRLGAIENKLPTGVYFRTEPEIIAPDAIADLVITIDGERISDHLVNEGLFSLFLEDLADGCEQEEIEVFVELKN